RIVAIEPVVHGKRRRPPPAPGAGRRAVRHCHAAADRRGAVAREPQPVEARRSRLRSRAGPDRIDSIAGRAIPGSPPHPRVLGGWGWGDAAGLPPNQPGQHNNFALEGSAPDDPQPVTPWVATSPEYAPTLGLKLIEGRLLDERDVDPENLRAVVVDRAWARRFFPNQSAVGKRLKSGGRPGGDWRTAGGVLEGG